MSGLFGCIGKEITDETINNFISPFKEIGYCITDLNLDSLCLLGKIGTKSTKINDSIIIDSINNIIVLSCGDIFNDGVTTIGSEILNLYKEKRLDSVDNLNGSFLVVIYDYSKEKITIINDRHGSIKLYYKFGDDYFCFSPIIKPLSQHFSDKILRKDSVVEFMLFGYLLDDKTFFDDILQFPPASILEFSKNNLKLHRYWKFEYDENYSTNSKEQLIDELAVLWEKAVERRINKNENLLIPLSGGLDSRAILAAALKYVPKSKIITVTFGEKGSFDYNIGKKIAEHVGVKNILLDVDMNDFPKQYLISIKGTEGIIDATPYLPLKEYEKMYMYSENLCLGFMGDPIMGSHILASMLDNKLNSKADYTDTKDLVFALNCLNKLDDINQLFSKKYFEDNNLDYYIKMIYNNMRKTTNKDVANFCAIWDYLNRQNNYIMNTTFRFKEKYNIITPFLDTELINFMLKVPPELRVDTNLYKSMLFKKYPELFSMPTKNNLGLPLSASNKLIILKKTYHIVRKKINKYSTLLFKKNILLDKRINYIDYDNLLRSNVAYNSYVKLMLNNIKKRELFDEDFIDNIWDLHMNGKKNYSNLFGLLVTFELFMEEYFDDRQV